MKVNYDMISPKLHYLVDIICMSDASSQGEILYYNQLTMASFVQELYARMLWDHIITH